MQPVKYMAMEIYASSESRVVPFYALIPAAGSGLRLGGTVPKQYQKIADKTILRHTLDLFLSMSGLQEVRVIIDPAHRALYDDAVQGLSLPPPISGGKDRKESIFNGLKSYSRLKENDTILIHDAARPLVPRARIAALAAAAAEKKAATLALPVADTQKYAHGSYIDRKDLWTIQTPQGFHYGVIRDAHEKSHGDLVHYTDDTAIVAARGISVTLITGAQENFKITTEEDFMLAQRLMTPQRETRTGSGYDVHAFEPGDKVRLCGIDIPHNKSLKGHSDADAALHALTDAVLGTIGAGDIGTYFPPSDSQWKGTDSSVFLRKALELVHAKGGKLINIDLTLICEEPKIGPFREAMQNRLSSLCGLTADRIGLKATTNEKLGFIGRGEGIAAQALACVSFPAQDSDHA